LQAPPWQGSPCRAPLPGLPLHGSPCGARLAGLPLQISPCRVPVAGFPLQGSPCRAPLAGLSLQGFPYRAPLADPEPTPTLCRSTPALLRSYSALPRHHQGASGPRENISGWSSQRLQCGFTALWGSLVMMGVNDYHQSHPCHAHICQPDYLLNKAM
jgi:hypothetical protein